MVDVVHKMPELDSWGPAPGYALALAKGYRWPRFHLQRCAVMTGCTLGSGAFSTVVDAAVFPDDRVVRIGALKIATPGGLSTLSSELEAIHQLSDQRAIPEVLAWAASPDGNDVAAILFVKLSGTLTDDVRRRFKARHDSGASPPYPTADAPLYSPTAFWAIIRPLAQLLAAAHARGVFHCNIKGCKVLLDAGGNPKLCGWGLMRMVPISAVGSAMLQGPLGTAGYALPELSAGSAVPLHHSVDTQPLALTTAFMLLAQPPEVTREHYRLDRSLRTYLPEEPMLRTLITSTLQPRPELRVTAASWVVKGPTEYRVPPAQIVATGIPAASADPHTTQSSSAISGTGTVETGTSATGTSATGTSATGTEIAADTSAAQPDPVADKSSREESSVDLPCPPASGPLASHISTGPYTSTTDSPSVDTASAGISTTASALSSAASSTVRAHSNCASGCGEDGNRPSDVSEFELSALASPRSGATLDTLFAESGGLLELPGEAVTGLPEAGALWGDAHHGGEGMALWAVGRGTVCAGKVAVGSPRRTQSTRPPQKDRRWGLGVFAKGFRLPFGCFSAPHCQA